MDRPDAIPTNMHAESVTASLFYDAYPTYIRASGTGEFAVPFGKLQSLPKYAGEAGRDLKIALPGQRERTVHFGADGDPCQIDNPDRTQWIKTDGRWYVARGLTKVAMAPHVTINVSADRRIVVQNPDNGDWQIYYPDGSAQYQVTGANGVKRLISYGANHFIEHERAAESVPTKVAAPAQTAPADGSGIASPVDAHDRSKFYLNQSALDFKLKGQGHWFSCGAASLTMAIADWKGVPPSKEEALHMQLITETKTLINDQFVGEAEVMAQYARNHGLKASCGNNAQQLIRDLKSGKSAIIDGISKLGVGHFVYIAGLDANGNFIVADPGTRSNTTWSAAQLESFNRGAGWKSRYVAVWT